MGLFLRSINACVDCVGGAGGDKWLKVFEPRPDVEVPF